MACMLCSLDVYLGKGGYASIYMWNIKGTLQKFVALLSQEPYTVWKSLKREKTVSYVKKLLKVDLGVMVMFGGSALSGYWKRSCVCN